MSMNRKKTEGHIPKSTVLSGWLGKSDCYFYFCFSVFSNRSITTYITLTKKDKNQIVTYFTKKEVLA